MTTKLTSAQIAHLKMQLIGTDHELVLKDRELESIYKMDVTPVCHRDEPKHFHVDLSKIALVSAAYHIDRMGSGGDYVAFWVEFQLRDKPTFFEFYVSHTGTAWNSEMRFKNVQAHLEKLQKIVDSLIMMWENYKMNSRRPS